MEVLDSPILVLVLLINATHESCCRREDLIDEDEDSLLGGELDPLADDVDKLTYSQIRRDKVLLLIDGRDVALLDLLANDLCPDRQRQVGNSVQDGEGSMGVFPPHHPTDGINYGRGRPPSI